MGIDYVIDLPKNCTYGETTVFIVVCHLTRMAHFVPYHKEIMAEEPARIFISNCYKLHGVPKIIVSDTNPIYLNFWGEVL